MSSFNSQSGMTPTDPVLLFLGISTQLLFWLAAFSFCTAWGSGRTLADEIEFEQARRCVADTVKTAGENDLDVAALMARMLDQDKFAWRVAYARNGDRDFGRARDKVHRVFSKPLAGPAFKDIDLMTVAYDARRSREIRLRLGENVTRVPVFELIGSYAALRTRERRLIKGKEELVPKRYDFVMWILLRNEKCSLVDLTWHGLNWARHINRLD